MIQKYKPEIIIANKGYDAEKNKTNIILNITNNKWQKLSYNQIIKSNTIFKKNSIATEPKNIFKNIFHHLVLNFQDISLIQEHPP